MKVEYINHMGDDLAVVNAARVSFDKESRWEWKVFEEEEEAEAYGEVDYDHVYSDRWFGGYPSKKLSEKDQKLIKYLATHDHWTPFAHCMITLREKVPIFIARQRMRSTVGFTYNEVSRRYVDSEPEFYVPDVWRKRAEDKKQGSSEETVQLPMTEYWGLGYDRYRDALVDILACYETMLDAGVCPEQARMVLPQSMYTEYITTGSLAAFARAYKLRSQPDAQAEIRFLATEWDRVIRPLFPHAWSSLVDEPVMECSR